MSSNKNAIIAGIAFAIIFIGSISLVMVINFKEEKHEFELAWWQKTLIYHVYLPSYKDTDGNGCGDIQGKIFFPKKFYGKVSYFSISFDKIMLSNTEILTQKVELWIFLSKCQCRRKFFF